ncbi:MAG: S-adenosylmethionine:tRNA ribosyltransferase-isomerase, partial [Candidatus Omnitrophota bacterium]
RYQMVFARVCGSVAAPTAGLHFTKKLLRRMKDKGVELAYVTLHIGPGTFRPVRADDVRRHKMEAESFSVGREVAEKVGRTRKGKGRVCAVGTTSCRALETVFGDSGKEKGYCGRTELFILPGYEFKAVDCLLTNFHLPKSTLFMLVCAFAGEALIKRAYKEAIGHKYRFYSYGDAMLIV